MHSVVRSDFLNGLLFLDRLQRDSCFHLRAEAPPLPRFHFCSLSEAAILYLIDWSEFWGAPQFSVHSVQQRHCRYTALQGRTPAMAVSRPIANLRSFDGNHTIEPYNIRHPQLPDLSKTHAGCAIRSTSAKLPKKSFGVSQAQRVSR